MGIERFQKIQFKTFEDERGKLTPIELTEYINWPVKRVYYVTDVKESRGGHAVRGEKKIYIMMQGSCKARLHDGEKWHDVGLKGPSEGILMEEMCFREFSDFSEGSVLAIVSNMPYDPDAYIYDLEEFIKEIDL